MTDNTLRPRIGMYPGSFDLLTNGHLDLIRRARNLVDHLVVAIGVNISKEGLFSLEERLSILRDSCKEWDNVEIAAIEGLTVEFARKKSATILIRGLRAVSDFEFELQLSIMNHTLGEGLETIFLPADQRYIFLSSSMVKDVWIHEGDISGFVPKPVLQALENKKQKMLAAGTWPA